MMQLIARIIPHLESLGIFSYWIIFLVATLESFAFVGLIIPGTTFIVIMGILASQGALDVGDVIAAVALGGVIGDALSFYLGTKGKSFLNSKNKFFKQEHLAYGEKFFLTHGDKSVFLARFFGPLRPIIPFVAGVFKMSKIRFFIFNILSSVCAAGAYVMLGYFFGQASLSLEKFIGRVGIFSFSLFVVVVTLYLFKRWVVRQGQEFFSALRLFMSWVFSLFSTRPRINSFVQRYSGGINFLKKRTYKFSFIGLPLTLSSILVGVGVFVATGLVDHLLTPTIIFIDQRVGQMLFLHRYDFFVHLFKFITFFGTVWVVPVVTVVFSILLLFKKKYAYIVPLYLGVIGSVVMVFLIKMWVGRPRPSGIAMYQEYLFSFPSLHSVEAVVLYGYIAYVIIVLVKKWTTKMNVFFGSVLFILAIGFSRLYLGVHFLSDVVGGYVLGALWLWWTISLVRLITYQQERVS
jgi:undecaprenyl-diphosphatase